MVRQCCAYEVEQRISAEVMTAGLVHAFAAFASAVASRLAGYSTGPDAYGSSESSDEESGDEDDASSDPEGVLHEVRSDAMAGIELEIASTLDSMDKSSLDDLEKVAACTTRPR